MLDNIYVQIPAYRDKELLVTIRDLVEKANHPNRLRIAIAWQYHDSEKHLESLIRACGNIELFKIPSSESKGCNWARNLLQKHWNKEPYTLFLDSHHRFVSGWDDTVINLYKAQREAGIKKPIITAYLPPYDPLNDPQGRTHSIYKIHLLERHQKMMFRLTGHAILNFNELTAPVPAHFVSLHFLFTHGEFNHEIRFDPDIYFFADEIVIALRAYTKGYDLFHPHCILGWHLYDRSLRRTHWSDHANWSQQNDLSCQRLRSLFKGKVYGTYGLGDTRGISDYEEFIGTQLIGHRA